MKKELDIALCTKYPILYRQRYMSETQTCMCWGFECGNGWYEIIDRLSAAIEAINNKLPPEKQIYAEQVKEKFGGLRFYISPFPLEYKDEINSLIDNAEEECKNTCEICGKPGKLGGKGWLSTLCDECRIKKST